jgi:hypothetical protein
MELEPVWQFFIDRLLQCDFIDNAYWKKVTGIPFLYIISPICISQCEIDKEIIKCSAFVMKGIRLHSDTIFVRKEAGLYVYRHRFYVPQEKMFCCGNLCEDCTRLKN